MYEICQNVCVSLGHKYVRSQPELCLSPLIFTEKLSCFEHIDDATCCYKGCNKNKYLNNLASEEINFFHVARCTEK